MTVLLESLDLVPPVKNFDGFDLWYGNFKYRVKIIFPSIRRVRYINDLSKLKKYLTREFWIYNVNKDGGDVYDLERFIKWKQNKKGDLKVVIHTTHLIIYYNDRGELSSFFSEFPDKEIMSNEYREKIPYYTKGIIYRVNPRNRYRIYLRATFMSRNDITKLNEIIQEQEIRITDGFSRRIQSFFKGHHQNFVVWDNNFIDIDDEAIATVLLLNFPNLIRKICEIKHFPE
jgi:hypothetical protein